MFSRLQHIKTLGAIALSIIFHILLQRPSQMPRTRRSVPPYSLIPSPPESALIRRPIAFAGNNRSARHLRPAALRAGLCLSVDRVAARPRRRRAAVAADHAAGEHAELRGRGARGNPPADAAEGGATLRLAADRRAHPAGRAAGLRQHRGGRPQSSTSRRGGFSWRASTAAARWPCGSR